MPGGPTGTSSPTSGPTGPTGTSSPTSGPTGPTETSSPTSGPTGPTGTTSPTSGPTSPTGTTSPTSGPTSPTGTNTPTGPTPPKRIIRKLQVVKANSTSGVEANISRYIDTSVNTVVNSVVNGVVNKTVYDMMKTVFYEYKFPKMMIIHRGVEVSTASKNVVNFVYHLDILDYLDPLTGNPNVFDVYLQKYQVIVDNGAMFSSTPNLVEFIVVNKIEKNSFDSLQNSGAYISYKLYSDSHKIYVKYVSFTDVLGVFGSFYSIFSLFAGILSGLYNELFLERKLISSVFRFIANKPDDIQLEDLIFVRKNNNFNNNSFFDKNGFYSNSNNKVSDINIDKIRENDNSIYTKIDNINIIEFQPNKEKDKNIKNEAHDLNSNNLFIEVENNKLNQQKEQEKNLGN